MRNLITWGLEIVLLYHKGDSKQELCPRKEELPAPCKARENDIGKCLFLLWAISTHRQKSLLQEL